MENFSNQDPFSDFTKMYAFCVFLALIWLVTVTRSKSDVKQPELPKQPQKKEKNKKKQSNQLQEIVQSEITPEKTSVKGQLQSTTVNTKLQQNAAKNVENSKAVSTPVETSKKSENAPNPKQKMKKVQKSVAEVVVVEEEKNEPVFENPTQDSVSSDEWNEIKEKKKVQKPKLKQNQITGSQYGGMTSKGTLVAGPVLQQQPNKYGGAGAWEPQKVKYEVVNHASVVADYDFGVERGQTESKYETYSHICSSAVAQARIAVKLTQSQLATKVNEKTATIVELENGHGRYSADLINRIESALKVQIPRGRKPQQKKK